MAGLDFLSAAKKRNTQNKSNGAGLDFLSAAKQGADFYWDAEAEKEFKERTMSELRIGDKTLGRISTKGYKAIQDGTVDAYTPINDDEAATIAAFKSYAEQEAIKNSPYAKFQAAKEIGQYGKGNVDLYARPKYKNEDGSISTVESISINEDGKEVLIPTVITRGERNPYAVKLSEEEAIQHYKRTGEHLGKFDSVEEANEYAQKLHNAQDFYYGSKYTTTAKSNVNDVKPSALTGLYADNGFEDITYDYINRNKTALDRQELIDVSTNASFAGVGKSFLKTMTDDEVALFNYLYKNTGKDTAYQFLSDLEGDLNLRSRLDTQEYWAEYAKQQPIRSSIFSVATSPLKGLSYVGQIADYADDGEIDQNAGYNKFSYANSAIRNQNTENIESPVGKFLYQTGMSLGDFAANTVAAGGMQPVSLALMGAGAAADTTIAARDRGVSSGKALALGTISGIAEAAMEKIAFDRLFSLKHAGEGAAKYILGNMLTEGTEELATDAINLTADILISKDKSEWHQKIQEYMAEGKSKEDAIFQAIVDQGISMGASFLGGAISGGVLSGATTARINALGRSNRQNVDSIINEGLSADVNSVAYKSAAQLQKTHEGYEAGAFKKDVPNFDVGYQMILNESYAAEEAQKTAKAGDAVTPQTIVDSTAAPIADTAAVTPVSDAAATTQSPAAETTAPATVSVGDTFHDTKYGNTITVVARDDASTTVEINTGKGTERKVLTNEQASVLVTRGQYEQTGSAVSDVYTAITRGNITAKQADAIVDNPALRSAFERLTGEKLTGTKAEQRATVRNWATNEANIENLRLKKAGLTQAHAKVASLLENPVSANIRMIAKSATLAQAFTDLTGVTLEGDMGAMRSAIKANTALAMESYADAIESSGWDAFNTSSTPSKSTSVEKTDADAGVDASDVFKTDTDGKIRFKQMDIDYTNTKMRKGTFRIRGERATDVNTVDGHIRGKYGICKLDGEKAYVVSLLQSGLEIGKFKTLAEAKKVATYADDNFAFNDVEYAITATGKYVSVMTDAFRGYLNDVQQMLAEKPYGVKAETEETATETKETVETKTVDTQENTDDASNSRDSVEVEGKGAVAWNSLTERQQQAITFMEGFAKAANMKLVFTAHGKVNGAYDIHGDTMYLDIYASENPLDNTEGLIIPTASHELTHWMRFQVPALWNKLSNAVFSALEEVDGISRTDRINAEIERLRNSKLVKSANADVAEQEIVSRACEDMLARSEQGKKIFESLSKSEQKTLTAKIKNVIAKIKDWISGMLSSYESGSREAATLRKCEAKLEEISKLWDEALAKSVEVSKSKPNDPRATTRNEALAKYGIQFDMGTKSVAPTSLFSERTWTESEYVQNRETAINAVMKATGVDRADAERYINNINSIARLIADDRARLDYEPNMDDFASVLKSNSEYKWTVDMSTLCAKRLLTTGTFDAIQKALPDTVFDSDDIVKLRSMMLERGYEVACGICYVESTRRELGPITAEFIKRYKMSQETGKPITRVNSEGKVVELTKTKEQKETTADKSTDKFFADKNYTPTLADLNTTDIDRVKVEHPLVYEAYLNFMNARGQAKPKLLETRAEYKGEILKHFKYKNTVNARNRAGGLRVQSFSDFEVAHLIDMMQIALDMSRVGLMSQAYTKVPAFAEVFGDTGIKINLSLIAKDSGLDENGNLIFDDVEGIPHEDAFRLRDEYSKNVGTVLVGKNDAHIIAAMADPRIDYIIPFHKSSWKESLYDALGLTGYEDYTDTQNEKPFDKSREINNFQPSEYWDYFKTGEENAKIYLEKCEKDGRRPKFPQFIGYDGYWKLLIDFKMYDNDGVGSPQTVVMPEFNMDAANRILSEYKGGHRSLPVAQDVVKDFVEEYKSKADADIDTGDTAMYNGEEAGSDGILYSQREGYWVPDLTRTQMASLRRAIKDDIGPSVNQITDTANWLFTSISGTKVLAIYSTENPNNPTLLYESKGKQATLERQLIEWILEDYNYGTSDDGKSKTFDAILSGSWLRQGSRVQNSSGPLGRGGGARNARVLQGKPSSNPSRAFKSVIENLFKVSGDGVVYSERDSQKVTEQEDAEYMEAYYDGDDDKCQELVDRVANRLGYTYKAYHHTENAFTVFDLNKARKSMDIQGFFFSADPDAEREYGSARYDTYLKMTNPYIVDSKEAQKAIPFDMSKGNAGVTAREWLQSQGYDSVIRKAEYFGAEADEYIVFDSAQIKSAEPYTFADDANGEGDIIPLSERFNPENDDIRYSLRDNGVPDIFEAWEEAEEAAVEKPAPKSSGVKYNKAMASQPATPENKWVADDATTTPEPEDIPSLSELVKDITDSFGLPVKSGKVTARNASGIYKILPEVIRTKISNDLPTIVHELGHHLSKHYGLEKSANISEADVLVDSNWLAQYSSAEVPGELAAEFVRRYFKNPEAVTRACPNLTNDFLNSLDKKDAASVSRIAPRVYAYMSAESGDRYGATIVDSKQAKRLDKEDLSDQAHDLYTKWLDGFHPIKQLMDFVESATGKVVTGAKNAYKLATNSLNANTISNFVLLEHFRDLDGNLIGGYNSFVECVRDVDLTDGETRKSFSEYLKLKHALEVQAKGKRVFADEVLGDTKNIQSRLDELNREFPEFEDAAKKLYEFQHNILTEFAVKSGLMTQEQADFLRDEYPCYVPFHRYIKGKKGSFVRRALANQKSPIQRMKGSGLDTLDPLESIVKNTEKIIAASIKHQTVDVLGTYADTVDGVGAFIERVPPDQVAKTVDITALKEEFGKKLQSVVKTSNDYFAVTDLLDDVFGDEVTGFNPVVNEKERIIAVQRGDERAYYQVHNEALFESITELSPRQASGLLNLLTASMGKINALITQFNPMFSVANPMRDIMTAYDLGNIDNPIKFITEYARSLKLILTSSDEYTQFKAMGGGHASRLNAELGEISKSVKDLQMRDAGPARRLAYAITHHPIQLLTAFSDFTESIPRFMTFLNAYEKTGDLHEAMYQADDITTNFKRRGSGATAKAINGMFRFNNAALQGLDKTRRTLTDEGKERALQVSAKWLTVAILGAILRGFFNRARDEEGYENLSSYKKNNFYNIALGDGQFLSLPKERENAVIDSFVERVVDALFGEDDAFYDFGGYLASQLLPPMLPSTLNPVDAVHELANSTLLGPFTDIGFNKDFKGAPIESDYEKDLVSSERYGEGTSKLAYALGQTKFAVNADLSPKKIDHILSTFGFLSSANKALAPVNDSNRDWTLGLRNRFISDSVYSTDVINKLYDNRDLAKRDFDYGVSQGKATADNAIEYEQTAVVTDYISGMNKAIKAMPENEQRRGRAYLVQTLNRWNYDNTSSQNDMIGRLDGIALADDDCVITDVPDSLITWTVKGTKCSYQMTPQEYNEYVTDYLALVDKYRLQQSKKYSNPEDYLAAMSGTKTEVKKAMNKKYQQKYSSKATKTKK